MDFSLGDFSIVDTLGSEFPSDAVDAMGSNLTDVTPVFSYSGIDPSLSDYANSEFLSPDLQGSNAATSIVSGVSGSSSGYSYLSGMGQTLLGGLSNIFKGSLKPSGRGQIGSTGGFFPLLVVGAILIGIIAVLRLK